MSKLDIVNTYHDDANYWAPLYENDDDDNVNYDKTETCASAADTGTHRQALIRRMIQARLARETSCRHGHKCNTVTVVIDSGATSHFIQESDKLPYLGKSNKNVYLPDGSTIQATHTVSLPFDTLNAAAREAHVLPELKGNSLLSVPILATHGYTTIFHAGSEGVEVYQKDAVKISATTLPVLQGWREQSGL